MDICGKGPSSANGTRISQWSLARHQAGGPHMSRPTTILRRCWVMRRSEQRGPTHLNSLRVSTAKATARAWHVSEGSCRLPESNGNCTHKETPEYTKVIYYPSECLDSSRIVQDKMQMLVSINISQRRSQMKQNVSKCLSATEKSADIAQHRRHEEQTHDS